MKNYLTLLTETQLRALFNECLDAALKPLKTKLPEQTANPLMTIKEVCIFFNVAPSTVHCWRKEGKLQAYYKGRRVYFKREEVLKGLIQSSK